MEEKIRIIIADDNKAICEMYEKYLKEHEEIEILKIVYNDNDEVNAIEELKPDIVITDLVRNRKYTGLDIIKDYANKKDGPDFLVISADKKNIVIPSDLYVAGYIEKPFFNYDVILEELYRINEKRKTRIKENNYTEDRNTTKSNFKQKLLEFINIKI